MFTLISMLYIYMLYFKGPLVHLCYDSLGNVISLCLSCDFSGVIVTYGTEFLTLLSNVNLTRGDGWLKLLTLLQKKKYRVLQQSQ